MDSARFFCEAVRDALWRVAYIFMQGQQADRSRRAEFVLLNKPIVMARAIAQLKNVATGNINVSNGYIIASCRRAMRLKGGRFMKFVGTKYKSDEVGPKYDAIVLGSGMGSLSTAALLSKAGKKILVLEKHYTAGGFTHSYSRKGYEWTLEFTISVMFIKRFSPLRMLFSLVTDGKLEWYSFRSLHGLQVGASRRFPTVPRKAPEMIEAVCGDLRAMPGLGEDKPALKHRLGRALRSPASRRRRAHRAPWPRRCRPRPAPRVR